MSVINRVLHDLAQRDAGLDDAEDLLRAVRPLTMPRARRRRVVPMATTGAAVLAAALWWVGRTSGESGEPGEATRPMAFMASAEAAALVRPPLATAPVITLDDAERAAAGGGEPSTEDAAPRDEAPEARFSPAYERAMEALDAGHRQDAEKALAALLEECPDHLLARQTLMGLMLETDRNLEAESLATEGLRHFPAHLPFAMTAARLQAESGDLRTALETLERFGAAGDGRRDLLAFHASLLQQSGLHADAVERYGQALALGAPEPLWLVERAISLRRLGQAEQARAQLREVASMKRLPAAVRSLVKRELALL